MKTKVKILETPCDYIDEDIPAEIDFSKGKPNPFLKHKKVIAEIEPDIAHFFRNSNVVNNALRILISAIPEKAKARVVWIRYFGYNYESKSLKSMKYIFSNHAKEKIEKRKIPYELIGKVLINPDYTYVEDEITIFQSIINIDAKQYLLRIFVNCDKLPNVIVTVYLTNKISKYLKGIQWK